MESTEKDVIYELNSLDVVGQHNRLTIWRNYEQKSNLMLESYRPDMVNKNHKRFDFVEIEDPYLHRFNFKIDEELLIDNAPIIALKAKLLTKFEIERERVKKIAPDIEFSESQVDKLISLIASLKPDKAILQLTVSYTVFVRVFIGDYELHLELFLDAEDGVSTQTMFIIYQQDVPVVTGSQGLIDAYNVIRDTMVRSLHYASAHG